jgi:serine/threonine protein kinase
MLIINLTCFFAFLVLQIWLWRQRVRINREAYMDGGVSAVSSARSSTLIFPLYIKILWVCTLSTLIDAMSNIFLPTDISGNNSVLHSFLYGGVWASYHFVFEGIAVLMLNPGVGAISARRSALLAGIWAIFTWLLQATVSWQEGSAYSLALSAVWSLMLIVFYLCLWLLPMRILFRRPCIYAYARFWVFMRGFLLISIFLRYYGKTFGFCVYLFTEAAFQSPFVAYVVYSCLLRDCQYWLGILHFEESGTKRKVSSAGGGSAGENGHDMPRDSSSGALGVANRSGLDTLRRPLLGTSLAPHSARALAKHMDMGQRSLLGSGATGAAAGSDSPNLASIDEYDAAENGTAAGSVPARRQLQSDSGGIKILNFAYLRIDEPTRGGHPAAPGSGGGPQQVILGSGSSSRVFRGTFKTRPVAIKMIFCPDLTPDLVQRFYHEAALMAQLRHENVVRIEGVCVLPPAICLVMELMEGGNLFDYLRREHGLAGAAGGFRGGLTLMRQLQLCLDCCRAVEFLHGARVGPSRASVMHLDLKSLNFLLTKDGRVKVSDLELSREIVVADHDAHTTAVVSGSELSGFKIPETLYWLSPELMQGLPYNEKADVYSLGLVLWEVFTASVPFRSLEDSLILAARNVKYMEALGLSPGEAERNRKKEYERERLLGKYKSEVDSGFDPGAAERDGYHRRWGSDSRASQRSGGGDDTSSVVSGGTNATGRSGQTGIEAVTGAEDEVVARSRGNSNSSMDGTRPRGGSHSASANTAARPRTDSNADAGAGPSGRASPAIAIGAYNQAAQQQSGAQSTLAAAASSALAGASRRAHANRGSRSVSRKHRGGGGGAGDDSEAEAELVTTPSSQSSLQRSSPSATTPPPHSPLSQNHPSYFLSPTRGDRKKPTTTTVAKDATDNLFSAAAAAAAAAGAPALGSSPPLLSKAIAEATAVATPSPVPHSSSLLTRENLAEFSRQQAAEEKAAREAAAQGAQTQQEQQLLPPPSSAAAPHPEAPAHPMDADPVLREWKRMHHFLHSNPVIAPVDSTGELIRSPAAGLLTQTPRDSTAPKVSPALSSVSSNLGAPATAARGRTQYTYSVAPNLPDIPSSNAGSGERDLSIERSVSHAQSRIIPQEDHSALVMNGAAPAVAPAEATGAAEALASAVADRGSNAPSSSGPSNDATSSAQSPAMAKSAPFTADVSPIAASLHNHPNAAAAAVAESRSRTPSSASHTGSTPRRSPAVGPYVLPSVPAVLSAPTGGVVLPTESYVQYNVDVLMLNEEGADFAAQPAGQQQEATQQRSSVQHSPASPAHGSSSSKGDLAYPATMPLGQRSVLAGALDAHENSAPAATGGGSGGVGGSGTAGTVTSVGSLSSSRGGDSLLLPSPALSATSESQKRVPRVTHLSLKDSSKKRTGRSATVRDRKSTTVASGSGEAAASASSSTRTRSKSIRKPKVDFRTVWVPRADVQEQLQHLICVEHYRPTLPPEMPDELAILLTRAWHPNPQLRPAATEFVKTVQELLRRLKGEVQTATSSGNAESERKEPGNIL